MRCMPRNIAIQEYDSNIITSEPNVEVEVIEEESTMEIIKALCSDAKDSALNILNKMNMLINDVPEIKVVMLDDCGNTTFKTVRLCNQCEDLCFQINSNVSKMNMEVYEYFLNREDMYDRKVKERLLHTVANVIDKNSESLRHNNTSASIKEKIDYAYVYVYRNIVPRCKKHDDERQYIPLINSIVAYSINK